MATTIVAGIQLSIVNQISYTLEASRQFTPLDDGTVQMDLLGVREFHLILTAEIRPYGVFGTRDLVLRALSVAINAARIAKTTVSVTGLTNTELNGNYSADLAVDYDNPFDANVVLQLWRAAY